MKRLTLSLAIFALFVTGSASAAELATQKVLTLEAAKEIAAAARAYADDKGWNVNIAICDASGDLLYFERKLGVQAGSIDVALLKAESAAKFKRPTKAFSDGIGGKPGLAMIPGALAIEGGLPLAFEGDFLGSIGVSGVTSEQDGMIAQAGVDALESILE